MVKSKTKLYSGENVILSNRVRNVAEQQLFKDYDGIVGKLVEGWKVWEEKNQV